MKNFNRKAEDKYCGALRPDISFDEAIGYYYEGLTIQEARSRHAAKDTSARDEVNKLREIIRMTR